MYRTVEPLDFTPETQRTLYLKTKQNNEVTISKTFLKVTHPAGSDEILYANQVALQLCEFLEVFQPSEAVLECGGHLCDGLQGICGERPLSTGAQAGGHGWNPPTHPFGTGTRILKGRFNSRNVLLPTPHRTATLGFQLPVQQVGVPAVDPKLGLIQPKWWTS